MTEEQAALLVDLHDAVADLAKRSPTFRVCALPILRLMARIKRTLERPQ